MSKHFKPRPTPPIRGRKNPLGTSTEAASSSTGSGPVQTIRAEAGVFADRGCPDTASSSWLCLRVHPRAASQAGSRVAHLVESRTFDARQGHATEDCPQAEKVLRAVT